MADLISQVPEHWGAMVRPFLQRADEFQAREPVVSYYLRTHVAFLCMQKRTKDDKAGTKFLMTLLEALEKEKKALGEQLDGSDGRTVLTRFALMLFAKADDEERAGRANLGIVRLFFASSVLFDATRQFTDDGEMDRIAGEKCKYAKYIAAKMKKALDAGEPYVSPNPVEKMEPEEATKPGEEPIITAPLSTAPPSSYLRKPVPPPLPPSDLTGVAPPAPPSYSPPSSTTNHAQQQQQQQNTFAPPSYVPPQPAQPQPSAVAPPAPAARPAAPMYAAPAPSSSASSGFKPSVDEMIDAQKYARQAMSALQFYDYNNAKQQLVAALNILNGTRTN